MRPDRGFATISAIFILVVLAGLGIALVTISSAQQRAQVYDVLGTKAYQAAHAGIENGLYEVLRNGACGTLSYALPSTGSLAGFSVEVTCTASASFNDGGSITVYDITATSCNPALSSSPRCPGAAGDRYVERQLRASVCRGAAC